MHGVQPLGEVRRCVSAYFAEKQNSVFPKQGLGDVVGSRSNQITAEYGRSVRGGFVGSHHVSDGRTCAASRELLFDPEVAVDGEIQRQVQQVRLRVV